MDLSGLSSKERIFLFVALFYVMYIVFPLLSDVTNIPVWLPSLFAVIVFIILFPSAFANKTVFWFGIYTLVLYIFIKFGRPLTIGIGTTEDSKKLIIEIAYILPSVSIFSILIHQHNETLNKYLTIASLSIIFASFLVTLPLMVQYQSIRSALTESENVKIPGLPGYSLMHAYALLLPAICCWHKTSVQSIWKFISLFAVVFTCFIIYNTFVTTSLLVMIGTLCFSIAYRENINNIILSLALIILLLIFWKSGLIASIIDWIMPAFTDTQVESKLLDFKAQANGLSSDQGTIYARNNLHDISINSFLENPIIGQPIVGGHSSILDRFGGMGIIGGIPYLMIFISFIDIMIREYRTKICKTFFSILIVGAFVFLYEKGLFGYESWLMMMVISPFSIFAFEDSTPINN